MPTGYTIDICTGEDLSARNFILKCARNFGALIHMRDEPLSAEIPEVIKPDNYYPNRIEELTEELQKITENTRPHEYWVEEYNKAYADAKNYHVKKCAENKVKIENYKKILEQVNKWEAPEDHQNLKRFAIEQLETSIKGDDYAPEFDFPEMSEWIEEKTTGKTIQRLLKNAEESYQKEIESANRRTKWLQDLRKSIENIE